MTNYYHLIIFIITINSLELFATPELSLFSGNRCSKCHVSYNGGGIRNDFGKIFGRDFAHFQPKSELPEPVSDFLKNGGLTTSIISKGLNGIFSQFTKEKNSAFDTLFSFGLDFRYQSVRSHKTEDAVRKWFPMQGALYLSVAPFAGIQFHYEYNLGPIVFYGQKKSALYTLIKPDKDYPSVRFGFFQPSIGIKMCDMTAFDRRYAGYYVTEPIIPPGYAEYGIETNYEGLEWLTLQAGVYKSKSAAEMFVFTDSLVYEYVVMDSIIRRQEPLSYLAKFIIWPEWLGDFAPSSYLGASLFINGGFRLINLFAGVAAMENLLFTAQYVYSSKNMTKHTFDSQGRDVPYNLHGAANNILASVSYIPFKGIILGLRGEWGVTNYESIYSKFDFDAVQLVASANIILVPFIEILPEYRFLSTEEYRSTRWAFQVHVYF